MSRGYFRGLASEPAYADSRKNWFVSLEGSSCYWYELIVNPPDFADTKGDISSHLEILRTEVERTLEKRFIYFFASRTKVRFDTSRPPRYSFWKKRLIVNLLIGRKKKRFPIEIDRSYRDGLPVIPKVEISERFIRFTYSETESFTFSVHEFLRIHNIGLGIATNVQYVGITKDPSDRPLSRKHRGIADTLYNVSNEENDFFLFVNVFKVSSGASNEEYGLHFFVANSLIDEIPTEMEGKVVESALIAYFDCASQRLNREKERAMLRNQLASLADQHNIQSVAVHLEMQTSNEYYVFGSDAVPPALSHSFLYRYSKGKVEVERFSSEYELQARFVKPQ